MNGVGKRKRMRTCDKRMSQNYHQILTNGCYDLNKKKKSKAITQSTIQYNMCAHHILSFLLVKILFFMFNKEKKEICCPCPQ